MHHLRKEGLTIDACMQPVMFGCAGAATGGTSSAQKTGMPSSLNMPDTVDLPMPARSCHVQGQLSAAPLQHRVQGSRIPHLLSLSILEGMEVLYVKMC